MRSRHPARLAARLMCCLIEVQPVDYDALDEYIDQEAARETQAQSTGQAWRNVDEGRDVQASPA